MKDVLYFEAKNQKNIHSWYLKIGDHIRDKLSDSCYISEEADDPYEPDYRIDVTFEEKLISIIIVVYEDEPIKGSITFEATKDALREAKRLKDELGITIKEWINEISEITFCNWMRDSEFRKRMYWPKIIN